MSRKSMQTKLLCVKFLEGIVEAVLHFTCLMTSKECHSINVTHLLRVGRMIFGHFSHWRLT